MRNREFVFTPKIEYKLVAERSEANLSNLRIPFWCSILELVRTHFSGKIPPRKFGKAAEPHRSKPQKNPEKNIGSPARLWREPYFNFGGRKFFNPYDKSSHF